MNPDQLTWANAHSYTKHYAFKTVLVREDDTLHLQQNETLRKVSYNAEGGFFCIIQREVDA